MSAPVPAQFTITPAQAQVLARTSPNQVDPNYTKTDPNIVYARTADQPRVAPSPIGGSVPKGPMTYHSGAVQHTTKIFAVFWGQASDFPTASYESDITSFLTDLGSLQDTNAKSYYNTVTQYYDTTNGSMANTSAFGGSYSDTTAYPATTISQTDIESAVTRAMTANPGWSVDTNSQVYVFTGENKKTCAGKSCSWVQYCGYHSAMNNDAVAYGNIPYGGHSGCTPSLSSGHSSAADGAINVLAHEVMEASVDPFFAGWFASNGTGEMADLCNFNFNGLLTGGGHSYVAQTLYSNADKACVSGYTSPSVTDCLSGSTTPTVSSISPASLGELGGTLAISGKNLTIGTFNSTVHIGTSTTASITTSTSKKLTVTVPAFAAGTQTVNVTTAGGCGTGKKSLTFSAPKATMVSPSHGQAAASTAITIKGTNLGGVQDVQFTTSSGTKLATSVGTVTVAGDGKSLTATAPTGTGTATIQLKDQAGNIAAEDTKHDKKFTYDAPQITSMSPKFGPEGVSTMVTVKGKNLGQVTQVSFGGVTSSSLGSQTDKSFTIQSDALNGSGAVHVLLFDPLDGYTTAGATATSKDAFTYKAPVLTAIKPTFGNETATTTVTIKGTNLKGVTQVKVGTNTVTATPGSTGTSLTLSVPPGSGTADLLIVDPVSELPQTAKKADLFTYKAPTISSISPASGGTGQTVSLSGKALDQVTTVSWTIGSGAPTTVTPSSTTATKITFTAPTGTKGDTATVTVSDGTTTATAPKSFTYSK